MQLPAPMGDHGLSKKGDRNEQKHFFTAMQVTGYFGGPLSNREAPCDLLPFERFMSMFSLLRLQAIK